MKKTLVALTYSTAFVLLLSVAGCGKAKSMYSSLVDGPSDMRTDTGPDRSGLKKRVLILPFLNQGGLSEKRTQEITTLFHSLLEKDSQIIVEEARQPIPSSMKMRSPKYGIIMDADAAKKAEEMGANVLITVVMNPYELRLKRTGIWPIRGTKREVEMSVIVNGLDLYKGTLFFSNLEREELYFKLEDIEDEDEAPRKPEMPAIDDKTFERAFSRIMERQASKLQSALKNLPWTGRILSAEEDKIIVNAGKRVGLSRDRIFEVFSREEQVRSANGVTVYLLGQKVGEVKAVEVMEDVSAVKPVVEAVYKAGQVIRAKR